MTAFIHPETLVDLSLKQLVPLEQEAARRSGNVAPAHKGYNKGTQMASLYGDYLCLHQGGEHFTEKYKASSESILGMLEDFTRTFRDKSLVVEFTQQVFVDLNSGKDDALQLIAHIYELQN